MLSLISALLLIYPATSAEMEATAPAKINWICRTEARTTTIRVETSGETVTATVGHHNGVEYAPFLTGQFTPHDLPFLKQKAEDALKLYPLMTFKFKLSSCKQKDPFVFTCLQSDEEQELNGIKVKTYSISASRSVEQTAQGNYATLIVRLHLGINDNQARLESNYGEEDCLLSR